MKNLNYDSNFTVVSYYTIDTPYKELAQKLTDSLIKFKINHDIQGVTSLGDWYQNTRYKAVFLQEMLKEYNRLVFIDADGIVVKYPDLFDILDCDIAATLREGRHLLSGTLFLQDNYRTNALINSWIQLNKTTPNSILEQLNLHNAIKKDESILFAELPTSYAKIYDLMASVPDSVIVHYQASRKYRRK